MVALKKHITNFLAFVEKPSGEDKLTILEKHLVTIYLDGMHLYDFIVPGVEYPKPIDYKNLRSGIEISFPELGLYHTILDTHQVTEEPKVVIGDASDDLTDIVKDLREAISLEDDNTFLWQLHHNFNAHIKQHLINLLTYLQGMER